MWIDVVWGTVPGMSMDLERGADNRAQAMVTGCFQEMDQPVEPIGIGEGQVFTTGFCCLLAEGFYGAHALHHRVVGMNVQVNEGFRVSETSCTHFDHLFIHEVTRRTAKTHEEIISCSSW